MLLYKHRLYQTRGSLCNWFVRDHFPRGENTCRVNRPFIMFKLVPDPDLKSDLDFDYDLSPDIDGAYTLPRVSPEIDLDRNLDLDGALDPDFDLNCKLHPDFEINLDPYLDGCLTLLRLSLSLTLPCVPPFLTLTLTFNLTVKRTLMGI